MTAPRTLYRCWRCHRCPVLRDGLPCPACRAVLEDEYAERVAENGGELLYLPSTGEIPGMTHMADTPARKPTRQCVECTREFEYTPRPGRPPARCPTCTGEAIPRKPRPEPKPPAEPAPRSKSATSPSTALASRPSTVPLPTRTASIDLALAAASGDVTAVPLDVPTFTKKILDEITALEDALAARMGVLRALERYSTARQLA